MTTISTEQKIFDKRPHHVHVSCVEVLERRLRASGEMGMADPDDAAIQEAILMFLGSFWMMNCLFWL